MFSFLKCFSNKPKSIPNEELDEFDRRFGFMLTHLGEDQNTYNMVKDYFYSNHK